MSSFNRFYLNLQEAIGASLTQQLIRQHTYLIQGDSLDIDIIYYIPPFDSRTTSNGSNKRTIHVDEDLWINRKSVLLSRISALAGHAKRIHARQTVIARIDKRVSLTFQEEYHLNAALPGKYRYGLFLDGDLVAIAVFSGGRRMRNKPEEYRSFELLRFCHKQDIHVVGGLSKLINGFHADFNPSDIMTYADKDWTDGKSYGQIGFGIVGHKAPQTFWINPNDWVRYAADNMPPTLNNKTEEDLVKDGFLKTQNSGSLKLVKYF